MKYLFIVRKNQKNMLVANTLFVYINATLYNYYIRLMISFQELQEYV